MEEVELSMVAYQNLECHRDNFIFFYELGHPWKNIYSRQGSETLFSGIQSGPDRWNIKSGFPIRKRNIGEDKQTDIDNKSCNSILALNYSVISFYFI